MAETPHESKPRTRLRRRKNGVALVVVLGAMALIAFLVLTILTLNRAEQRAATNSAELTDVRNLADLPAQVVISQIRRATQNLGTFFNWTSQPGLIRVFSVENSSDPDAAPTVQQFRYPLYSTQTLYASGPPDFAAEATELAQWANSKALYVDLNEPIEIRQDLTTGAPIPTANPGTLVYPILDPAAFERVGDNGESRVQGLAINGTAPATSPRHLMPMPVRWLYVLSTGKILSPLPGGDLSIARFDMAEFRPQGNEPAPRIIGRIAFWTDDESCKINLNTASEPAPWHPPMTVSERDRWAADTQPVRGETHRLSGHPAYTALSPVFRSLGGLASPAPAMQPQPQPPTGQGNGVSTFKDYLTAYHSLLPQTPKKDTGSVHGTELVLSNTTPPPLRSPALWSNVDEFLFDSGQPNGTGALRQRNGFQSVTGYALDEADIRRARFCLTTHSSAPETNPFNQPKISLWPIQTDPAQRTRTDQLMALAATIGGTADTRAYYGIQRDSAWSGTATPGSSHSTNADLATGSRNRQLFNWLQTSTSNPFPAHPGSFADKYGPLNRDQLLLSMFDLTRWTSNPGNAWTDNGPTYDYLAPSSEGTAPPEGSGMVTPLIADTGAGRTLRSPGRIPTITEAAIVFVAVDAKKDLNGQIEEETEGPWIGYAKKTTHVRAFIVLEPYITSPGFPAINPSIKYVLKGLNGASTSNPESPSEDMPFTMASHTLNGRTLNFGGALDQYELINQVTFSPSFPNITTPGGTARRFGGDATSFTGLTSLFVERDGQPRRALGILNPTQEFPWFSIPIDISTALPEENPMLNYSGGDLVLEIRHATTDTLLQEIALPFTQLSGQIPMPRLPLEDFAAVGPNDTLILNRFNLLVDPANPNAPPYLPLIKRGDVVRAVTLNPTGPHRGDVRMLSSRYRVPKDWFTPAAIPPGAADDYEKHGLRETTFDSIGQIGSTGTNMLGAQTANRQIPATTVGSLLQNGPPLPPFNALPQGVTAAFSRTALQEVYRVDEARYGDWETGSGSLPDGPFFSRQDLTNAISQEDARRGTRDNIAATYTDGGELAIDAAGLSHTPQRQVSSAFIFGALTPFVYGIPDDPNPPPTGPPNPEPWRTLLFCPNPISRTSSANAKPNTSDHPGFGAPDFKIAPDHLWLEFFWTPVVEPQFLSPAFSTQGKVNLNCQMIPFTWIERTTALHAAFKGVRIPAIHHSAREIYKAPFDPAAAPTATAPEILYEVDVEKTLKAFRTRFTAGQVFYHPSEICDTYLFPRRIPGFEQDYSRGLTPPPMDPANVDYEQLNEWWNGNDPNDPLKLDAFELTGDNLRESPYAQVYPRLCTRSNVYKVHYRVQLISKSRSTPANQWNVETEKITAEQRGAVTIERYLDPNDPNIPDMTGSTLALDDFYRYRILTTEPFTP
jgi:uncharacterized protein (TIGR02600 family)